MKEIIISNGRVTLVDDCDHRTLSMFAWQSTGSHTKYVTHGYWDRGTRRMKHLSMHVVVAGWMGLKIPPGHEVDHKNRDTFDNQRDNLRVATQSVNGHNSDFQVNNTSGVIGVYWAKDRGKWLANISVQKKLISLGYYRKFEDAVAARIAGEQRYIGHEYTANQPGPAR